MLTSSKVGVRIHGVVTGRKIWVPFDLITSFLGPAMAVRVFQTGVQANSTWTVLFISPSISKLCIIGRVGVLIRHHQIVSIASVKVTADTGQYVLTLVFGIRGYVHTGAFVKSYLKIDDTWIARLINPNDKEKTHLENLNVRNFHLAGFRVFTRFVGLHGSVLID